MAEYRRGNQARRLWAVLLLIGVMTSAAQGAVLSEQTVFNSGLTGADPLVVSLDGQQVYAGSSTGGALSAFQRDATGSFGAIVTYTAAAMSGSIDPQLLQSLAVSPDGQFVYAGYEAGDKSAARIAVLQRDNNGALGADGSVVLDGSTRISALAASPDGAALYAVDENTLYVYSRDVLGQLTLQQQFQDNNPGGVDGLAGAWAIVVSPDSRFVYVTGAADNAIAVFQRGNGGQLTFLVAYKNGVGGISGLANARGIVISSDGLNIYVAAAGDNAVTEFSRDDSTGLLQFAQVYKDGASGVDGLSGAFNLALSPEGSQLYVLGSAEDALTVLRRDGVSGDLTQVEVLRQGPGSPQIDGLDSALGLAVHPDGKQLFVTSPLNNSLAVFGVAAADLNLAMQVVSADLTAGAAVQFQLVMTNHGPDTATGVVVDDTLPVGTTTASGSFAQSQCTQQATQLYCAIGDLLSGEQMTVMVSMTFATEGAYINTAVAAADQRDPAPGDNRDQVSLSVAASLNKAPVAEADQANTLPGVAVDIPVLANDHDPDGDGISLSAVPAVSQHGGALSIDNGGVHYVPASGFHGLDSFKYTIADSEGATAEGLVQVTVNTPPDAKDDTASVVAGTSAAIHVLVNDADADSDPLSIVAAQTPSAQGAAVSVNSDGTVSYIPPAAFTGNDSFSYTVADGYGGTATAQVSVKVAAAAGNSTGGTPDSPSAAGGSGGGGSVQFVELLVLCSILLATYRRRS